MKMTRRTILKAGAGTAIALAGGRLIAEAKTVLVDEVSRPERFAEVAAIAELLDVVQLTRVVALAPDGDLVHATRTGMAA